MRKTIFLTVLFVTFSNTGVEGLLPRMEECNANVIDLDHEKK